MPLTRKPSDGGSARDTDRKTAIAIVCAAFLCLKAGRSKKSMRKSGYIHDRRQAPLTF
jgi:hypothetical protein